MYDKSKNEKAAVLLSEVASDAGAIMLEMGRKFTGLKILLKEL